VQPHLGKCFDGIGKLVFGENNIISGMYSGEGEKVLFGGETITPTCAAAHGLWRPTSGKDGGEESG